jgi:putative transcriptional regulator
MVNGEIFPEYAQSTKCAIITIMNIRARNVLGRRGYMKESAVRFLRLKAEVDTEQALKTFGISKSMLSKIELGHRLPSSKVICKMSALYDCSIDEIYKALGISRNMKKNIS